MRHFAWETDREYAAGGATSGSAIASPRSRTAALAVVFFPWRTMDPLRIIFMGTPELAKVCFQALLERNDFLIVGAVTQPDRPSGRDLKVHPSPVKELALARQIPVFQPQRARSEEFLSQLRTLQPELIAVAAFGQILPQSVLDLPRFGCLNVHTSLLPKYRGAAPIQWAILNGESETGVTIMKMNAQMDSGDILTQQRTPIHPDDNAAILHDRLAEIGAGLLARTIPEYVTGNLEPRPQAESETSYAPKIKKQNGEINWHKPAAVIRNQVRGLVPWPGAFTRISGEAKPQFLKIWQANVIRQSGNPGDILTADKTGIVVACGEDALQILTLQREGGRQLTAQEFLAGHVVKVGERLA